MRCTNTNLDPKLKLNMTFDPKSVKSVMHLIMEHILPHKSMFFLCFSLLFPLNDQIR